MVRNVWQHADAFAGGNATADQAASGALRHFAPQIQHPDAAQESWEQAASGDAADAGGSDRLTQLTHVVWPAIPERLQQRLATQCPRLHFNAFKHSPSSSRKVGCCVQHHHRLKASGVGKCGQGRKYVCMCAGHVGRQ